MAAVTNPLIPENPFSVPVEVEQYSSGIEKSMLHSSIQIDEVKNDIEENFLVVSPYDELPHRLDLRSVDTNNQLLAKALVKLECLRADYATAEYIDIFNWPEVVGHLKGMATASNLRFQKGIFVPGTSLVEKRLHTDAGKPPHSLILYCGLQKQDPQNHGLCRPGCS
jgi:hypothetical protein